MKVLVAASGGSGFNLALKVYKNLPDNIEKYFISTMNAKTVMQKEENINSYDNENISAPPASGSFGIDKMIIVPCSMNTLAKISNGIADNLVTRSASVMIKEKRDLLLAPRELPFCQISLKNMKKLSKIGVFIAPPVMGYYADIKTLEDMENFVIGKWFDLLKIEHQLYKRWGV